MTERLSFYFKTKNQSIYFSFTRSLHNKTLIEKNILDYENKNSNNKVKTSSRRLQDLLQDVFRTSWKTKNCYAEDVLKTSWRHVLKTFWRHVLKTSWRCLAKTSSRRLQDVFKTSCKTSWKTKNCYAEDVLMTSWRHDLKTSWRPILKTSWRPILKTSWRRRQAKCLPGISVSNRSKYVSNKSIFHKSISDKSKANSKCVT